MGKRDETTTSTTGPGEVEYVGPAGAVIAAREMAAIVDRWFADTFGGAGLPTDLHNRFRAAADALKERLAALK